MSFFFNYFIVLSRTDFCPTFFTVWPMSFRIVETLILLGEKLGCYKISLECKDPLLSYYTQFGFKLEEGQNYLCKRFYHWELNASWVVPEKNSLLPLCLYQMSFFQPTWSTPGFPVFDSSLMRFSCTPSIGGMWTFFCNYPIIQKYINYM